MVFAGRDEDVASADDAHPLLHLVVRVEVVLHGLAPPALPEHLGLDLRLPALDNRLTRDHLQYSQPASTRQASPQATSVGCQRDERDANRESINTVNIHQANIVKTHDTITNSI